jgi:hypothetical protein
MGGAKLSVDGQGFHSEANQNKLMFNGKFRGYESRFESPPLSNNDEFESKPAEGTLALTVPAATELMRSNFGELYDEPTWFKLSVLNT